MCVLFRYFRDAGDIALLKSYGVGPYTKSIKQTEDDIKAAAKKVKELAGELEFFQRVAPAG